MTRYKEWVDMPADEKADQIKSNLKDFYVDFNDRFNQVNNALGAISYRFKKIEDRLDGIEKTQKKAQSVAEA